MGRLQAWIRRAALETRDVDRDISMVHVLTPPCLPLEHAAVGIERLTQFMLRRCIN